MTEELTGIQQIKALRQAFGSVPMVRVFEHGENGEYLPQPDARIPLRGYLQGWQALHANGYAVVDTLTREERKRFEEDKRRAAFEEMREIEQLADEAVLDGEPAPAWGLFARPLELWVIGDDEQPVAFDTEAEAQERADAWNADAAEAGATEPDPYEVRRLPSDTEA